MDNTKIPGTINRRRLNELLVLRSQLGETEALGELIEYWQRPLLYYVRRLMNEQDAGDVLQTATNCPRRAGQGSQMGHACQS